MPFDFDMTIGRFTLDWGYHVDNKPWFTDVQKDGFLFTKVFNANFYASAFINREDFGNTHNKDLMDPNSDVLAYGARADFATENFQIGLQYFHWNFKDATTLGTNDNVTAYNINSRYNFRNYFLVFGEYWRQNLDPFWMVTNESNPNAYRVGFFVPQSTLKYTNLWVEYNNWDAGFVLQNDPFAKYSADVVFAVSRSNMAFDERTNAWFGKLEQKWSDTWSTFGRYVLVTQENTVDQKVTNWSVGVIHKYTPSLSFELSYDNLKFENLNKTDDHLIRFKTNVSF
ncbi:MAG: hypothetical protein PHT94_00860 [Candidatus Nanoarchaeia archaeon]|nr:hypothetical protein [Candidatus Nanoarchaeia archaeon]